MWHCPHCGAPQAETARCWVCQRSSTTCSTCRHFRVSLTPELGYCGLDRDRRPLTGRELRGCWTERPATSASAAQPATGAPPLAVHRLRRGTAGGAGRLPERDFVPVEELPARLDRLPAGAEPGAAPAPAATTELPLAMLDPVEGWEARTSLFGELER
jgi:hypothetical protein